MFCQATRYIKDDIDNNVVCDTLKFLENIQAPDGSFPEGYAVRHREMIVRLLIKNTVLELRYTIGYSARSSIKYSVLEYLMEYLVVFQVKNNTLNIQKRFENI